MDTVNSRYQSQANEQNNKSVCLPHDRQSIQSIFKTSACSLDKSTGRTSNAQNLNAELLSPNNIHGSRMLFARYSATLRRRVLANSYDDNDANVSKPLTATEKQQRTENKSSILSASDAENDAIFKGPQRKVLRHSTNRLSVENENLQHTSPFLRKQFHSTQLHKNDSRTQKAPNSSSMNIKSNKQQLNFGCVDVGDTVVESVKLFTGFPHTCRVKVMIKHRSPCFQLINFPTDGYVNISSNKEFNLQVLFCPSHPNKLFSDKVVFITKDGQRLGLPVMGFGGCANIGILNSPAPAAINGGETIVSVPSFGSTVLTLMNSGTTAAFVKLIDMSTTFSTLARVSISPNAVVLQPRNSINIRVDLHCTSLSSWLHVAIGIFWGEQHLRNMLRAFEVAKNDPIVVRGQNFTEPFLEEVSETAPNLYCYYCDRLFVGCLREHYVFFADTVTEDGLNDKCFEQLLVDESTYAESFGFGV